MGFAFHAAEYTLLNFNFAYPGLRADPPVLTHCSRNPAHNAENCLVKHKNDFVPESPCLSTRFSLLSRKLQTVSIVYLGSLRDLGQDSNRHNHL